MPDHPLDMGGGLGDRSLSRRQFLTVAAAAAALGVVEWSPVFKVPAASAQSTLPVPPNFPKSIELYQQAFQNWSGEVVLENAWTCAPESAVQVVTLANWAYPVGYQIRARGMMHNWSPLVIPVDSSGANLILADTTQQLTSVSIDPSGSPATVTAETGVTMDVLLQDLEDAGLGLTAHPAPGDITIGGALAIDGHGTAVPAVGETMIPGHTYGSLSNLILSLTAVVWNPSQGQYVLQTFERSDPAIQPLLAHLGRSFITEVTLQVGANSRLRCQSFVDVAASALFGAPGSSSQTFDSYVDQSGRVETIWFPFTSSPWLKVWTIAPEQAIALQTSDNALQLCLRRRDPPGALRSHQRDPRGRRLGNADVRPGRALDYHRRTSRHLDRRHLGLGQGSAPLCETQHPQGHRQRLCGADNRSNIQQVIYEFTNYYQSQVAAYQAQGNYPMNGPVEIRVTGLDSPTDVKITGALTPQLSALRPRPDQPDWNVAVWFDILTMPTTPYSDPVLPGHRAVDVQQLHRILCVGRDPMVQRVGVHQHGCLVRPDHAWHHDSGRHQCRTERWQ